MAEEIGKEFESYEACCIGMQGKVPNAEEYCKKLFAGEGPVKEEAEQDEKLPEQKSTPLDMVQFRSLKFYAPPKNKTEEDPREAKDPREHKDPREETEEKDWGTGTPVHSGTDKEKFGYPKRSYPSDEVKSKGPLDSINLHGLGTNYDEGEEDTDTNKQAHDKSVASENEEDIRQGKKPRHPPMEYADELYEEAANKSKKVV